MDKKLINEIKRINQLMLINEQPTPLITVGRKLATTADDFIKKFIKSDLDDVAKQEVDAIATRVRRGALQSLDELADDELRILLKHVDYSKMAKQLFDNGLLISRNTIDTNTQRIIDAITTSADPVKKYKDLLLQLKNGASTNLWGTVPDMADELLPMADEYYTLWLNQIKNSLKTQQPALYEKISKSLASKIGGTISKATRTFIEDWGNRNLQTIRRVLTDSLKSQETLASEFLTAGDDMAKAISQGKSPDFYTKLMADKLTAMNKALDTDIESIIKSMKTDPKYTRDIAMEFERSDSYQAIVKAISEQPNARQALIDYATAWRNLLWPFSSKQQFYNWGARIFNMILQQSPYTFEETVKLLQNRGLYSMIKGRVASGVFTKWIAIPFLSVIGKTLLGIPMEGYERLNNAAGGEYENPWGPTGENGRKDWFEVIGKHLEDSLPEGFEIAVPFGTFIDEIYRAIMIGNTIKAEDYVDEDVSNAIREMSIPNELKDNTFYASHIKPYFKDGNIIYYWDSGSENSQENVVEKRPLTDSSGNPTGEEVWCVWDKVDTTANSAWKWYRLSDLIPETNQQ